LVPILTLSDFKQRLKVTETLWISIVVGSFFYAVYATIV